MEVVRFGPNLVRVDSTSPQDTLTWKKPSWAQGGAFWGPWNFYVVEIESLILAMIKHDLKICFGGLIGGLKPLPNQAKSFWIRPFFDPPGPSKVFLQPFSACSRGVSPHSDFFASLFIWSQDFIFYDKNASLVGENQIWVKTESTIFGHFFLWKPLYFQGIFWVMELTGDPKLVQFITHDTIIWIFPTWVGRTPPKGVFWQLKVPASSSKLIKMINIHTISTFFIGNTWILYSNHMQCLVVDFQDRFHLSFLLIFIRVFNMEKICSAHCLKCKIYFTWS